MEHLSTGLSYVDDNFQNLPGVVATAVVHDGDVALIDPGPSTSLPTLEARLAEAGISLADIRAILLTHIHFDHAGATGSIVAQNPAITVYVHEVGAPHLANPEKLVASARRLLGDQLNRVWGEFRAVRKDAIKALKDGETIAIGGRRFDVTYTPGHASHHVSYFDRESGVAFVGDVAAMQFVPNGYLLPPTPPPDIDLELWRSSLRRVDEWQPDSLFLTHFGPAAHPSVHLSTVNENLTFMERLAAESLDQNVSDVEREAWFIEQVRHELRRHMSEAGVHLCETAARLDWSWRGLARYIRKRNSKGVSTSSR